MEGKYDVFRFGKKATEPPTEDNKTSVEDARVTPPDSVTDQAKENLRERKRARRSDTGTTRAKKGAGTEREIIADQLQALYSQEAWKLLVAAPANAMLSMTGHDFWNIPDKELDALAATSALSARFLIKQDPKWLALILFMFNFGTVYGSRAVMEITTRKKEKEGKAKEHAEKEKQA